MHQAGNFMRRPFDDMVSHRTCDTSRTSYSFRFYKTTYVAGAAYSLWICATIERILLRNASSASIMSAILSRAYIAVV